jgi:hypothetical protein
MARGGVSMGRDIHVVLEKKTEAGWEYLDTEFDY